MTDFGLSDPYIGVMKGVILTINPDVRLIDLAHQIIPYDINNAAFILASNCYYFPPRTIHIAVVDPGVGGPRRPILVYADEQYFIGPDNGIFSYVYQRNPECTVRAITESHYFLPPRGTTFQGRDVFAPCAAWLTLNEDAALFGDEIDDYEKSAFSLPVRSGRATEGEIIYIDNYGNLITNIDADLIETVAKEINSGPPMVIFNGTDLGKIEAGYLARPVGSPVAVIGGTGYLEIAVNRGSARNLFNSQVGAKVIVVFGRNE